TAPNVAQAPPEDRLRIDGGHEERCREPGRSSEDGSLVVDDAGMAVEDQLVLAPDGVAERDEAEIVPCAGDEHLLTLPVAADVEGRGGDVDEKLGTGKREIRRRRAGLPHVFAHRRPDERLAVLEQDQIAPRREVPVLVEDSVVREEAFAVYGLDL